jgi:hypothetical protein
LQQTTSLSVKQQTSQKFIWIIYYDPNLDNCSLSALRDVVKGYPHFRLIPCPYRWGYYPTGLKGEDYPFKEYIPELYSQSYDYFISSQMDIDDFSHIDTFRQIQQLVYEIDEESPMLIVHTEMGYQWDAQTNILRRLARGFHQFPVSLITPTKDVGFHIQIGEQAHHDIARWALEKYAKITNRTCPVEKCVRAAPMARSWLYTQTETGLGYWSRRDFHATRWNPVVPIFNIIPELRLHFGITEANLTLIHEYFVAWAGTMHAQGEDSAELRALIDAPFKGQRCLHGGKPLIKS